MQFIPYLKEHNINVDVFSLLSDNSLNIKNHFVGICFSRFIDFVRTINKLSSIKHNDVVHIHIELFPWLPYWLESAILKIFSIHNYSLEYDDAWYHRYDKHPIIFFRLIYKSKIAQLMKQSQLVIAGNKYISSYAKLVGARNVAVIPTVVNFEKYNLPDKEGKVQSIPVIGWVGTPATTKFLVEIKSVIQYLHEKKIAVFHAFGADGAQLVGLPIEVVPWDESQEVRILCSFDIGIMPLRDSWFERGKCGYKLIQYMACGIPVVASPVGANTNIVVNGVNGFLAQTESEWIVALTSLCLDNALRIKLGAEGRRLGAESYSTSAVQAELVNLFNKLIPYNLNEESR